MQSDSRHHPVLWRVLEFAAHLIAIMCILHVTSYFNLTRIERGLVGSPPQRVSVGWVSQLLWVPWKWYSIPTVLGLIVEGFAFGRIGKLPIVVHYLSPPMLFGGIATIELMASTGSHNLWGIEVVVYFLLFSPILVGALLGRRAKDRHDYTKQRRGFPVEPLE